MTLSIAVSALLLTLTASLGWTSDAPLPELSIYHAAAEWTDQNGKTLRLRDLAGKPVAISMIYLTCTYTCPATVMHMRKLQKALPESVRKDATFVLVSFDPARDTADKMRAFAKKHDLGPEWRLITTRKEADLRELSTLIDFKYKRSADGEFEHSFGIVALDRQGRIAGSSVGTGMKTDELAKKLQ